MKLSGLFPAFLMAGILLVSVSSANVVHTGDKEVLKVQKLERAPNFFKSENMFFSGQPNLETLEWLKTQGVDMVINLRSDKENNDFSSSAFNEKEQVQKLGMKYISIPIDGYDAYNKENLASLNDALTSDFNKVLIHCAGSGRVTYFMMAYFVKYKDYELAEAIEFGKQLKFQFPLEYLLEEEIDWSTK